MSCVTVEEEVTAAPARELLRGFLDVAIAAADPMRCVGHHLPKPPKGRTIVVGAGKAAASMARALELSWPKPLSGMVVTRYGHAVDTLCIEVVEAAHPVPDEQGDRAARTILKMVSNLSEDDLVICLLSGGGSALLASPLGGVPLCDLQKLNWLLLQSGASITEMNCIRRQIGALSGGRLAAASYPARMVSLLISDVPGDDPCDIASGPTVGDPDDADRALTILRRLNLRAPPSIEALLSEGRYPSVRPGDIRLSRSSAKIISAPQMSLEAAANAVRSAGLKPYILSDRLEGEARHVGTALAGLAMQVIDHGQPFDAPCVLLSGGETTVTGGANGYGGRNTEFLLAFGLALPANTPVAALAADTDGIDGSGQIAGGIWLPDTMCRANELGLSPRDILHGHDAHKFFEALDDCVVTGPTLTNVNDFRAILIDHRLS
jgi:glycerate 2-kinase